MLLHLLVMRRNLPVVLTDYDETSSVLRLRFQSSLQLEREYLAMV